MDIFKALKCLDEGMKIRDIKMPSGVYLEKVDGKIISSQGRQGVDLNTDAKYEIYEEPKPKYIDEICVLLGSLDQYTKEKCTYDCNKCELKVETKCYRHILRNISESYNAAKSKMRLKEEIDEINKNYEYYEKERLKNYIRVDVPNYNGETLVKIDTSKDITDRIFNSLKEQGFQVRGL